MNDSGTLEPETVNRFVAGAPASGAVCRRRQEQGPGFVRAVVVAEYLPRHREMATVQAPSKKLRVG